MFHTPTNNEPRRRKSKREAEEAAPDGPAPPPKRYKSSYLCFSVAHQDEVKAELGEGSRVVDISKRMAEKWKALSSEERKKWDDEAKADRARYEEDMANYKGPVIISRRQKKDPSAPKRPMSAFLFFSQKYRPGIKEKEPDLKNTDVSKRLGEMWRGAPEEERNMYIQHEAEQRAKYKIDMAEWKKQHAKDEAKLKHLEKEERKAQKAKKAKERKETKRRKKEEEKVTRTNLPGGLTGNVQGDLVSSMPHMPGQFAGAQGGYGAQFGGRGAYNIHEGEAGNPLYALHSQHIQRSAAELEMMGLQSPYLQSAYTSLGGMYGMGTMGAGRGALGQAPYLQGLGGYGGLHSGDLMQGAGMGRRVLQGAADASLSGYADTSLPGYGYPSSDVAAPQMMGRVGYPSSSASAAQQMMGRTGGGGTMDDKRESSSAG